MTVDPVREAAALVARERARIRMFRGVLGRNRLVAIQRVGEYWSRRHYDRRDPFELPTYRDPQARRRERERRRLDAASREIVDTEGET